MGQVKGTDVGRVSVRDKGQVTLPAAVREALGVKNGDEIEFEVISEGEVLMRGLKLIPASQAWFWTESWQRGEREAGDDIVYGRVETFKDSESFLDLIKADDDDPE
jgi:AbrB family looped-hinge helix DNA binding protein